MHYQAERTYGCRVSEAWAFRDLKVLVLENEKLRVSVLTDKGADIFEFVHKSSDTNFMWRTPWGVRDPRRYLPSTGWPVGLWHDMYEGGWQTVAPTGGYPINYKGGDIGQHNESALMPWDVTVLEDHPERVSAKFHVRTARTPYFIEKTLTLDSGSSVLTVEEAVTNEAEEPTECVWGQHIALGEPFLNPNCRLDLPGARVYNLGDGSTVGRRLADTESGVWPSTPGGGGDPVDLRTFPARSDRVQDLAVFHDLAGGWFSVTDVIRGVGLGFSFPQEIFRYIWYWQVFGGSSGYPMYRRTYNVGLEPFSSLPSGVPWPGSEERTSLLLAPGERRVAVIRAVAYENNTGVEQISRDGNVTPRVEPR